MTSLFIQNSSLSLIWSQESDSMDHKNVTFSVRNQKWVRKISIRARDNARACKAPFVMYFLRLILQFADEFIWYHLNVVPKAEQKPEN